jgi:choline dehydrogenase-like flavoprotein
MAQLLQALPWYQAIERNSNATSGNNPERLDTLAALASRPAFDDYLGRTGPLPTEVARRFAGLPPKPVDRSWGNHINHLGNEILDMMNSQDRQSGQAGTTGQDVDKLVSNLVRTIHALALATKPQR